MAFNGSGVFNRLYNWANDKAANIKVRADRMDNEMNGFATGLSTCITKDGQTTITANIPFAGQKITGYGTVSAPSARNDVPSLGQVQDGTFTWVDGGGTADAITASYSPAVTALVDGMELGVRATTANATTTPTFSPNGLTARTIVKNGGSPLVAGDIAGDNHELILRYNLANTRWELLNPKVQVAATIPYTAASASGAASLEFAEDTDNGSNKVTLKAPASIAADADVVLPASGTLLSTAAAVTVAQGGTGLTTLTANNVILGNGTSNPAFVAPGTSGNVLTSNGTTWTSATPTTPSSPIKAWVIFDASSGTPSILNSFNVSSVTDNGAGDFTINFTSSIGTSNYAVCGTASDNVINNANTVVIAYDSLPTASSCRVRVKNDGGGNVDTNRVSVTIIA